jgi:hypothetical protein
MSDDGIPEKALKIVKKGLFACFRAWCLCQIWWPNLLRDG